jgi:hypothetical protein
MKKNLTKAPPVSLASISDDRIGRIRAMSDAIDKAAAGIVMVAMAIGDELQAEKDARPHGQFMPWLESNINRMGLKSTRTAREYMQLATNREHVERLLEENPAMSSMRAVFRGLGRGNEAKALQAQDEGGPEPTEPIPTAGEGAAALNPRSRRAFAVLTSDYRAAHGMTSKPKPRKPVARVTATMKPKAKRELERYAKRNHMTHGELIERLMAFADQLQAQAANSKGGGRRK